MKENIEQIEEMKLNGYTYKAIAGYFGVSYQRIQQVIRPPRAVKEALIVRADDNCESCGAPTPHGHTHHLLKPDIGINSLANLQYLCATCHMSLHSRQAAHIVSFIDTDRRCKCFKCLRYMRFNPTANTPLLRSTVHKNLCVECAK